MFLTTFLLSIRFCCLLFCREIRFLPSTGHLYRRKWIRFLMRRADVVLFNPIEPGDIKGLIAQVDGGRQVVIFAEGRMTENGGLMKIYEAPGLVADKSKAPLIPIWLTGLNMGTFQKPKGNFPTGRCPKS